MPVERLAVEPESFIHLVALKGGILMAGELHSPRSSADIDATTGRQRRIDPERVTSDLRRAGRAFNVRLDGEPERSPGGLIVFRFDSLVDAGTAKLEVSVREDLVFAVRDALFDVTELGIAPFSVPAVAEVELVADPSSTVRASSNSPTPNFPMTRSAFACFSMFSFCVRFVLKTAVPVAKVPRLVRVLSDLRLASARKDGFVRSVRDNLADGVSNRPCPRGLSRC